MVSSWVLRYQDRVLDPRDAVNSPPRESKHLVKSHGVSMYEASSMKSAGYVRIVKSSEGCVQWSHNVDSGSIYMIIMDQFSRTQ